MWKAQRVGTSVSDSHRVLTAADILQACLLHNQLAFYCHLTTSAKQLVLFGLALHTAGPCVAITSALRGTTAVLLCSAHAETRVTAMSVKWATSRDPPAQPHVNSATDVLENTRDVFQRENPPSP